MLVDGDKVLCTPGSPRGTIAALNKRTGEKIWQSADLTDPAGYSSMTLLPHLFVRYANDAILHLVRVATGLDSLVVGEEQIVLVRLARTPTVIVVPTDAGRLAIGAASEADLLEALGAAARVQQRLDEVSGRVRAAFPDGLRTLEQPPAEAPTEEEQKARNDADRFLTGIERSELEARLAAAREAALVAAEAERRVALEADAGQAATAVARPPRTYAPGKEPPISAPSAARERRAASWSRPAWATDVVVRTLGTISWALVPLVASLGAWGLAEANQALTVNGGTWSRLVALALTLGGPAAALAVVAARAWWPRLTGLVAVGALASLVLTARAAMP